MFSSCRSLARSLSFFIVIVSIKLTAGHVPRDTFIRFESRTMRVEEGRKPRCIVGGNDNDVATSVPNIPDSDARWIFGKERSASYSQGTLPRVRWLRMMECDGPRWPRPEVRCMGSGACIFHLIEFFNRSVVSSIHTALLSSRNFRISLSLSPPDS